MNGNYTLKVLENIGVESKLINHIEMERTL